MRTTYSVRDEQERERGGNEMATLNLIRTDDGHLYLQGAGDPSQNADFSVYDLDGEGGDPFRLGNTEWTVLAEVPGAEYDPEDSDTFWVAQEAILAAARAAGIKLPAWIDELDGCR